MKDIISESKKAIKEGFPSKEDFKINFFLAIWKIFFIKNKKLKPKTIIEKIYVLSGSKLINDYLLPTNYMSRFRLWRCTPFIMLHYYGSLKHFSLNRVLRNQYILHNTLFKLHLIMLLQFSPLILIKFIQNSFLEIDEIIRFFLFVICPVIIQKYYLDRVKKTISTLEKKEIKKESRKNYKKNKKGRKNLNLKKA